MSKKRSNSFLMKDTPEKRFTNTSSRTPSLRRKPSLYSTNARSFYTSQSFGNKTLNLSEFPLNLDETGNGVRLSDHMLDQFNGHIPFAVNEALMTRKKKDLLLCKIGLDGTAILITKQKLIIWNIKDTKSNATQELILPDASITSCDHVAFNNDNSSHSSNQIQDKSCIAVSSTGRFRFWNLIGYSRSYVDASLVQFLRGGVDECLGVVYLKGGMGRYLTAWLESGLILITIEQQGEIKLKQLEAQEKGKLTRIGRRFSSMIFGSSLQDNATNGPNLKRLLAGEALMGPVNSQVVFVLTDISIQKWLLLDNNSEKMIIDFNIEEEIRKKYLQFKRDINEDLIDETSVSLQDICLTKEGVAVLFACHCISTAQYGIVQYSTQSDGTFRSNRISFTKFELALTEKGRAKEFVMLWPEKLTSNVYIYDSETIVCFKDENGSYSSEVVNFSNLGAGCYRGYSLFLSSQGSLIKVQETVAATNQSMAESLLKNKTFSKLDTSITGTISSLQVEDLNSSNDPLSKLKAAFIGNMLQGNTVNADELLGQLYPSSPIGLKSSNSRRSLVDTRLDLLVVQLSLEMIDDFPAQDPRWASSGRREMQLSSSSSLILSQQLTDKLKAHDSFIQFLKSSQIWDKLTYVSVNNQVKRMTYNILLEHVQKIILAIAIRELNLSYANILDSTINDCIERRRKMLISSVGTEPNSSLPSVYSNSQLTQQDLFYTMVSRVDEVFDCLISWELAWLEENTEDERSFDLIVNVSNVIKDSLSKAIIFGQMNEKFYCRRRRSNSAAKDEDKVVANVDRYAETLDGCTNSWIASDDQQGGGVRTVIFRQHQILVEYALPKAKDQGFCNFLFEQLMALTDMILDTYTSSIRTKGNVSKHGEIRGEVSLDENINEVEVRKYFQIREDLMKPFVKNEQYEKALALSEKYCHFELLIQICNTIDDMDRLNAYLVRFRGQGFAGELFNWSSKNGQKGKLLMSAHLSRDPDIQKLLEQDSTTCWLLRAKLEEYKEAHEELFRLALLEKKNISRKRTLLSLSKLNALAILDADIPNDYNDVAIVTDVLNDGSVAIVPDDLVRERIQIIDNNQDLITYQEQVLQLPSVKNHLLIEDIADARVFSPLELIDLNIQEFNTDAKEFEFKKALELLKFIKLGEDMNMVSVREILIDIWVRSILKDKWDWPIVTADPIGRCRETLFYKLLELVISSETNLDEILPTPEEILESEDVQNLSKKADFRCQFLAIYENAKTMYDRTLNVHHHDDELNLYLEGQQPGYVYRMVVEH